MDKQQKLENKNLNTFMSIIIDQMPRKKHLTDFQNVYEGKCNIFAKGN
jgi:hypothetical protein